MDSTQQLNLSLRTRRLVQNADGYSVWERTEAQTSWAVSETALVLCDLWDNHWCRGAVERLGKLLPRMNEVVKALRERGVLIVHAPSDTMDFYAGTPARQRALDAPETEPPADLPHEDAPKPVDDSDGGSDTDHNVGDVNTRVWSRQHPAIWMDRTRDVVSDSGRELYNVYRHRGIRNVIIMGVHTNMCMLARPFAIKQMVRWGLNVALVRDLTDTMYNPGKSPYVSHEDGTRLVVEYIEAFWCPSVCSRELAEGC